MFIYFDQNIDGAIVAALMPLKNHVLSGLQVRGRRSLWDSAGLSLGMYHGNFALSSIQLPEILVFYFSSAKGI
jgi:hypothetical protein